MCTNNICTISVVVYINWPSHSPKQMAITLAWQAFSQMTVLVYHHWTTVNVPTEIGDGRYVTERNKGNQEEQNSVQINLSRLNRIIPTPNPNGSIPSRIKCLMSCRVCILLLYQRLGIQLTCSFYWSHMFFSGGCKAVCLCLFYFITPATGPWNSSKKGLHRLWSRAGAGQA